jgi:hypothetical protein
MIADFVARDAWSERDDFTRYIVGEDERWLRTPEGVVAEFLVVGIYWVLLNDVPGGKNCGGDSTASGSDFYHDFSFTRCRDGTSDFNERFACLDDLEGFLGSHFVTKFILYEKEARY